VAHGKRLIKLSNAPAAFINSRQLIPRYPSLLTSKHFHLYMKAFLFPFVSRTPTFKLKIYYVRGHCSPVGGVVTGGIKRISRSH
jgi:hypothetical protein